MFEKVWNVTDMASSALNLKIEILPKLLLYIFQRHISNCWNVQWYIKNFNILMEQWNILAGEKATFEARASTGAGVTATWLKDNKPLEDKLADRVKITSKDTLFSVDISNCAPEDSGLYTCRITATGGETATCSANLEVHSCKYLFIFCLSIY